MADKQRFSQLTVFSGGGYSLQDFTPGRGWENGCFVAHSHASDTEKMIAWAREQGYRIVDRRNEDSVCPTCEDRRVVPDGAHHSGLGKDYGGMYCPDCT